MTEPLEKTVRETARGRSERTPLFALTGVTIAVAILVAVVLGLALGLWLALR